MSKKTPTQINKFTIAKNHNLKNLNNKNINQKNE